MEHAFQFQKLYRTEAKKLLIVLAVVAITHALLQYLMLPYGNALRSLFPDGEISEIRKNSLQTRISSAKSLAGASLNDNSLDFTSDSLSVGIPNDATNKNDDSPFEKVGYKSEISAVGDLQSREKNSTPENGRTAKRGLSLKQIVNPTTVTLDKAESGSDVFPQPGTSVVTNNSFGGKQIKEVVLKDGNILILKSDIVKADNKSVTVGSGKKKMRCDMPPKSVMSISEMNHLLVRRRRTSRSLRPRWSSRRDQEMLAVKHQIENPPIVTVDRELYAPLFRNVSMFRRSYELMERTLKVYIYKEGQKPIFHQPILKGLYASEGWFMKLMEGNKQFIVKDPRRAHLFYMPFSSRMLEYSLYVRNSHNRTNLAQYLKRYSEIIAAKHQFWNRTAGADHFLVACHDWAPYETRHHMERCIKALCNADVTAGFKVGRDVSLPETYVRSARNPLRDLGGKHPSNRHILAFFAGNMHGYLRRILLKYWENKDPDMKIFGPMPPGVASKINYIQHMKSSRYCICPKGYEVNSPRVVEAIFYECVPVIISDNFVPPFFEVFDWGAFSVILAEKDIPNLKEILLSIPHEKYIEMQLGVRKVQQHFLWRSKPLKYDLFHMTLHSIWYNRVFQIKLR